MRLQARTGSPKNINQIGIQIKLIHQIKES
jgi:hypothetical protein